MGECEVKRLVGERVRALAERLDWTHLNIEQKRHYYEVWTSDESIGGLLRQVIEPGNVRVYLKDTIMKNYLRDCRPRLPEFLRGLPVSTGQITKSFTKPEAVMCFGRDLFTLTAAKGWKIAFMSAYERGFDIRNLRRNIVYITEHTTGRFVDQSYRDMINSAATKLGVEVRWAD